MESNKSAAEVKSPDVVFHIRPGEEHSLQISKDILDPQDFMFHAYEMALSALCGIIRYAREFRKKIQEDDRDDRPFPGEPDIMDLYGYPNNIIAFCAGRGQGKTSAMLSFTRALEKHNTNDLYRDHPEVTHRNSREDEESVGHQGNYDIRLPDTTRFTVLHPIDPTILEDNNCVMEVILSELFSLTEKRWQSVNDKKREFSETRRMDILRLFKRCLDSVRTLQNPTGGTNNDDSLGSLYQLGGSLDLRNDLYQLIQSFFRICGKDQEDRYLVIPIDDTDLQLGNAYRILEETRKYLSLPNVVVVMAADLDQLRLLVIQHYYEELKGAAEQRMVADEYVRRMATKYLDKLIPSAHAIFLPRIRDRFERNMELRLSIGATLDTKKPQELQNTTFNLIQEKTGLIFAKHRHFMHSFIPETLRGAQHLYRLLDRMESPMKLPKLWDPQTGESKVTGNVGEVTNEHVWTAYCNARIARANTLLSNLDTFQSYFIHDWCSSKLNRPDWETVKQIADAVTDHAVKYAALLLRKKVNDRREALSAVTETERRKDYWRGMYERPGDVNKLEPEMYIELLRSLDELERNSYTLREHALGFAVHTLFSIRFNKMALEIQREQLEQELKRLQNHERRLFCFDYHRIQNLLKPCLFDTREIQKGLIDRKNPIQLYLPVDCEPSDSIFYRSDADGCCCDLLHCFYQGLNPGIEREETPDAIYLQEQAALLDAQDLALSVCCNWDLQDQIVKAVLHPSDQEEMVKYVREKCNQFVQEGTDALNSSTFNDAESIRTLLDVPDSRIPYVNAVYFYIFRFLRDKQVDHFSLGKTSEEKIEIPLEKTTKESTDTPIKPFSRFYLLPLDRNSIERLSAFRFNWSAKGRKNPLDTPAPVPLAKSVKQIAQTLDQTLENPLRTWSGQGAEKKNEAEVSHDR